MRWLSSAIAPDAKRNDRYLRKRAISELRRRPRCSRATSINCFASRRLVTSTRTFPRARIYLGANCAHCHTMYGGGNSAIDFDWLLPFEKMRALGEPPLHGDFALPDARIIAPGVAARSVAVTRVSLRGPGQMPPVGTRIPDPAGTRLLVEWIESLRE